MGVIPNKDLNEKLTILSIGAHPDDADIETGGTAIKYLELGHKVVFVSLTNGDAGHQTQGGVELAKRRYAETQNVAKFLGLEYLVWENHDGYLEATFENRDNLIRLIRKYKPDLIISPRINDYHTDHRATALLIQNAAYMVAVPNICKDTPALDYNPVIVFNQDDFEKPYPFAPSVFVDISDVIDKKIESLAFHESQVFEWLPFIYKVELPENREERLKWMKEKWGSPASKFNKDMKFVEAFEASEYGGKLTKENVEKLFPFGVSNL